MLIVSEVRTSGERGKHTHTHTHTHTKTVRVSYSFIFIPEVKYNSAL